MFTINLDQDVTTVCRYNYTVVRQNYFVAGNEWEAPGKSKRQSGM